MKSTLFIQVYGPIHSQERANRILITTFTLFFNIQQMCVRMYDSAVRSYQSGNSSGSFLLSANFCFIDMEEQKATQRNIVQA